MTNLLVPGALVQTQSGSLLGGQEPYKRKENITFWTGAFKQGVCRNLEEI